MHSLRIGKSNQGPRVRGADHRKVWFIAPLVLILLAWYGGDVLSGECCLSDDECDSGLDCSGRRATCDVRLVFQNDKALLDVSPFGMSTRAVSISGRFLEAGSNETIDSFTRATYSQVRSSLADYLRTHPIDPGDLVVLDMEPGWADENSLNLG